MVKDLLSPRFRRLVEQKFDMDLSEFYPTVVMMGNTSGHYNEGYAHPDSKHKILTVILQPEFGKMPMFRVPDKSYHGLLPQKGRQMSLQFCWVDTKPYATQTYLRNRLSAFAKSAPGLREVVGMMPRKFRKGRRIARDSGAGRTHPSPSATLPGSLRSGRSTRSEMCACA